MTEEEWLSSKDPIAMLEFLRPMVSERKWRLYFCGGCRQLTHLFFSPWSLTAVEVAERFCDGQATKEEMRRAEYDAEAATFGYEFEEDKFTYTDPYKACVVPRLIELGFLPETTLPGSEWHIDDATKRRLRSAAFLAEHCALPSYKEARGWWLKFMSDVDWPDRWLFDCVFGNPFNPAGIDPSWFTPNVINFAQEIYDGGVFDHLPSLADALESAGCTDVDILSHCRTPGTHVKGCWVVDLILGKS